MDESAAHTSARGRVAIVLHAHLPYVRSHCGDEDTEERWLYEAMWECYLPLLQLLRGAAGAPGRGPRISLSLSPTLLAMLEDPHHRAGFLRYREQLAGMLGRASGIAAVAGGVSDHARRLEQSAALHDALRGKLVAAFAELAREGRLELFTTAATHAFLPGLLTRSAVRAQIRLGGRYLYELTEITPRGLWLPECGVSEAVMQELAASGASFTVVDEHALGLADPPAPSVAAPIVTPLGVACFGRHVALVAKVWSRQAGYPGDPTYREFHHDLNDVPAYRQALGCPWPGPSGIRPFRVTGDGEKQPYSPLAAKKRAKEHAADWVRHIDAELERLGEDAVVVLAFDAELFGHWFWEGPAFLEEVLRLLGPRAITLGDVLDQDPELVVAEPAESSWGDGGHAQVWVHPAVSHLVRSEHRAERRVALVDDVVRDTPRTPLQRRARLAAIRQLLLLQSSDFAFMIRGEESRDFVARRTREHAGHVERLTEIARAERTTPEDELYVRRVEARWPLFAELDEDALADALDAFE